MSEWIGGPPESVPWEQHVQSMERCKALQAKVERAEKERDEAMRRGAESEHAAQRLERGERADSIFARHDRRVDWPSDVHERPADAIAAALDLQGAKVERLEAAAGFLLASVQVHPRDNCLTISRHTRDQLVAALKEASHE